MQYRFGRREHDPAAVAKAPSFAGHRFALSPPPASFDRGDVPAPGLYDNDTLPDCTAADMANGARLVFQAFTGADLLVDPGKVPAFYAESIGMPGASIKALAATDGAVMLDVMTHQARQGFDCGPQLLAANFGVLPIDRLAIANALAHLKNVSVGIRLYEADMTMPDVWDTTYAPGPLAGRHADTLLDYAGLADGDTLRINRWGSWGRCTWRWLLDRTEEAYARVYRQLLGADPPVDADMLEAQLQRFTAA